MTQLLQPALCTAETEEVARSKEHRDTTARREVQYWSLSFSFTSLRTHGDERVEGDKGLDLPPQHTATEKQTSRMDTTHSWHNQGQCQ